MESFSYGDVVLYSEDLDALRNPRSLYTNKLICLWFNVLEERGAPSSLVLLSPEVAQLAKMLDAASVAAVLQERQLGACEWVVMPVNDSSETEHPGGGTHWSTLVWSRAAGHFYHLDSVAGSPNIASAREMAERVGQAVGAKAGAQLHAVKIAMQENGFDCGVFVCAIAELMSDALQRGKEPLEAAADTVSQELVTKKRQEIRQFVNRD